MRELELKVRHLQKALPVFSEDIGFACDYITPDPASSLTKSRCVMEKLLIEIYKQEMGHEPRKPLLGEILGENQFTKKLDRRLVSRMNSIRDMGNLGPHGEAVEPNDAVRVLDDLCVVLDWYLERLNSLDSNEGVGQKPDDAKPQSSPSRRRKLGFSLITNNAGCSITLALTILLALLLPLFWDQVRGWFSESGPERMPQQKTAKAKD